MRNIVILLMSALSFQAYADLNSVGECTQRRQFVEMSVGYAISGVDKASVKQKINTEINDRDFYKDRTVTWLSSVVDNAYQLYGEASASVQQGYASEFASSIGDEFYTYCISNFHEFSGKNAIRK